MAATMLAKRAAAQPSKTVSARPARACFIVARAGPFAKKPQAVQVGGLVVRPSA